MAIYLCVRSLNARVDMNILSDISRVIAPLLAIYGVFRAVDLINRDAPLPMMCAKKRVCSGWRSRC